MLMSGAFTTVSSESESPSDNGRVIDDKPNVVEAAVIASPALLVTVAAVSAMRTLVISSSSGHGGHGVGANVIGSGVGASVSTPKFCGGVGSGVGARVSGTSV